MFRKFCFILLLISSTHSYALGDLEADEMADLTAMFVFLKDNCGQKNISDNELRDGLVRFANVRRWDLSNYNAKNMQNRALASYLDLSQMPVEDVEKCRLIKVNILGLLKALNK